MRVWFPLSVLHVYRRVQSVCKHPSPSLKAALWQAEFALYRMQMYFTISPVVYGAHVVI